MTWLDRVAVGSLRQCHGCRRGESVSAVRARGFLTLPAHHVCLLACVTVGPEGEQPLGSGHQPPGSGLASFFWHNKQPHNFSEVV